MTNIAQFTVRAYVLQQISGLDFELLAIQKVSQLVCFGMLRTTTLKIPIYHWTDILSIHFYRVDCTSLKHQFRDQICVFLLKRVIRPTAGLPDGGKIVCHSLETSSDVFRRRTHFLRVGKKNLSGTFQSKQQQKLRRSLNTLQ